MTDSHPANIPAELLRTTYQSFAHNHGLVDAPFLFLYWLRTPPASDNFRCQVLADHLEHSFAQRQAEHYVHGHTPADHWRQLLSELLAQLGLFASLNRSAW